MKRVLAVSKDRYLLRKIELLADDSTQIICADGYTDGYFDITFVDIDTLVHTHTGPDVLTMSRYNEDCDLSIPFEFSEFYAAVEGRSPDAPHITVRGRYAYVLGREVKLTELESALLGVLIDAGGEFVSRARILSEVWGDSSDEGIINVYIHYLREKLEDGEKIIISSRKNGYKIDGRYL